MRRRKACQILTIHSAWSKNGGVSYKVPEKVLHILCTFSHEFLNTSLCVKYYYHHFADEYTEIQTSGYKVSQGKGRRIPNHRTAWYQSLTNVSQSQRFERYVYRVVTSNRHPERVSSSRLLSALVSSKHPLVPFMPGNFLW